MVTSGPQNNIETLWQTALDGDQAAYREFLNQAAMILRRQLAKRVPNADLEDVVQTILISVHKARHTYDGQRAAMPWLMAIARYRLADYLRKQYANAWQVTTDDTEIPDIAANDVTESTPLSEYMHVEVAKLPKRQQEILHMLHTEGYTTKEVGKKLSMNQSAVKVMAHRAYKAIKAKLSSHG